MKTIEMAKEIAENNYWYPSYRAAYAEYDGKQIFLIMVLVDGLELKDDILDADLEDLEGIEEDRFTYFVCFSDEVFEYNENTKENWQQITKEEVEKIYEEIQ